MLQQWQVARLSSSQLHSCQLMVLPATELVKTRWQVLEHNACHLPLSPEKSVGQVGSKLSAGGKLEAEERDLHPFPQFRSPTSH